MKYAAEGAGSNDHIHGDEHLLDPPAYQEIAERADELIADKFENFEYFDRLMCDIDPTVYMQHLHRALCNLDSACEGKATAKDALLSALHQIQKIIRTEADSSWREDCMDEAIREYQRDQEEA